MHRVPPYASHVADAAAAVACGHVAPAEASAVKASRRGSSSVCVFSDIAFLTDALCCPVAHRCSRARKPDERSGSTLEVIGVRHRQALMILGRLRGCVCSRGGTPTAPPVIDGNFSVRMSMKSSPNPVHGGRVCVHRPWGDGGRPRGARDEHRRTPGRCSCRCSCRDSSGQLGPITLSTYCGTSPCIPVAFPAILGSW